MAACSYSSASRSHAYRLSSYLQLVNWGVEMMTQGAFTLREAERSAKGQKLRIWQNYTPPASAGQSMTFKLQAWPHSTQLLGVGLAFSKGAGSV